MSDYEICRQLLQKGMEFKVLVPISTKEGKEPNHTRCTPLPVRTAGYMFNKGDYVAYCYDRLSMLSDNHLAKRALKTGGIMWRLSVECSFNIVLSEEWCYTDTATIYTTKDGKKYFDDKCTEEESDAICGAYRCAQGMYDPLSQKACFLISCTCCQANKPEIQVKLW